MHYNYPNPFNSSTNIAFDVTKDSDIILAIYDIHGQEIISLLNERKTKGSHCIKWNGKNKYHRNVGSGVYYYQLKCNVFSEIKKMTVLR